jgi:hypothetical protein
MNKPLASFTVRRQIARGLRSGTRIDLLPLWCGKEDDGGANERPQWRDWTDQETTPDQQRMEEVLADDGVRGRVLLHVGVGNSSLAKRFHSSAHRIDGITIQENECRRASCLGI